MSIDALILLYSEYKKYCIFTLNKDVYTNVFQKILTVEYIQFKFFFVFLLDYSHKNFNETKKIVKLFTF